MTEVRDGGVMIRSAASALVDFAFRLPEHGFDTRAWPAARLEE
jgi:hypothetical protein